jgi:hypothetical protein
MESESDSDDSDVSEGQRAATDRLAPKTQKDYTVYINQIKTFASHPERLALYSECMNGTEVMMPVPLKLGKAFVCHLRDKMISWPMDGRPPAQRTYLKHYSCSKINNACLAIKNTFRKMSLPVPQADAIFYLDFVQAYVHTIARAKSIGAYPSEEGSIALGSAQIKKVINAAFRHVHLVHQSYNQYPTSIHHHTPPYTTSHHLHTPPYTTIHHRTPPYTTTHHHTPPYTTIHHLTPPHTTSNQHTDIYLKVRAGLNRQWRNCGFFC